MTEENMKPISKLVMTIGGLLAIFNIIVGFIAYPYLPEKVPTHWNFAGEVDGWGSAFQGAFLFPLIMLGVFILLIVVPKIDPKKKSYASMGKAYGAIILGTMVFFTVMYLGTLGAALGYLQNIPSLVQIGVGVLFIVIGNYMGKFKHNYFVGIRNPWTLANEEVWYKTHRVAGPIWVVGGLAFMLMSFLTPELMSKVLFVVIFALAVVPTLYSLYIFRKITKGEEI